MRPTRRFTAVAALGLTAALLLAGCTKKNETAGTTSAAAPGTTSAAATSAPASDTGSASSSAPASDTGSASSSAPASSSGGDSGKKYKVAFVPKLQGIPYFEAMNAGGKQAETDLGNVTWLYQGPTTADAAEQAKIARSYIQQKVDVLVVAPNDPDSMAPVLKEAQDAGIKVLTSDTDAPNSIREAFVNQASADGLGKSLTDTLLTAMGGKGKYAIVSCGETAANLNSWIEVQKAWTKEKYPEAEIVDIVYAGEDQGKATSMATDLMTAHPDLTGLVGECTSSAPGVAQAVKDADKIGKVFTVGLGTPKSMAPYLKDGSSSGSILWDVQALGFLTAWAGVQAAEGKPFAATNKVNDKLTDVKWDAATKTLLLGDPFVFTKENVDQFDY